MIEAIRESQQKKPHAPRVRVKRVDAEAARPADASPAVPDTGEFSAADGEALPAKKRRRRRKPVGGAGTAEGSGEASQPAPQSPSAASDS